MSTTHQIDPHLVTIHNVRLSYAELFVAKQGRDAAGQPQGKAVFSCAFILDKAKNAEDIKNLTAAAVMTKKEKWKDKPVNLTGKSIRDGTEKEATDGYGPGIVFISARNEKRPQIVNKNLAAITAEDEEAPYSGCYVDARVRCWAQDNGFGKRINWSLEVVQFRRHGEPFGQKMAPAEATMSKIQDEGDGSVDAAPEHNPNEQI